MPLYAVSIEKETRFHGALERFANTYHYDGPAFQLGDANFQRLVEYLRDEEQKVHSSEVAFKLGRVWSEGGTALENTTLGMYDLTGVGTMLTGGTMHAEAAVLVEWECERANILGRKVYLRKYIRPQGIPQGFGSGADRAKEAIAPAGRTIFKTYADRVANVALASGVSFVLVSPTLRRTRSVDNGQVDQFLRTREFRRN